jgi:hypothetical protein
MEILKIQAGQTNLTVRHVDCADRTVVAGIPLTASAYNPPSRRYAPLSYNYSKHPSMMHGILPILSHRLKEHQMHTEERILVVADVIELMALHRPYHAGERQIADVGTAFGWNDSFLRLAGQHPTLSFPSLLKKADPQRSKLATHDRNGNHSQSCDEEI